MKKYFLLLSLSLSFLAQAQNIKGPYVGVTTQFQNTWIINDEQYEDVNYKHRFTTKWAPFGFVAGYKFNENHNVQAEIYRSHQGEKFDLMDQSGNKAGEKEIDLVYWNIPLLFKYTTEGTLRFNFQVGPQLGILQKGTERNTFSRTASYQVKANTFSVERGNYLLASTEDSDRNNSGVGEFNQYDLGVLLGLGAEYSLKDNLILTANLRYGYNFVNIRKEEHIEDYRRDTDYYVLRQNMVAGIQLGINYLFNTGDGTSSARHE
ncbi:outer membrane beta-barrel protein [Rufibacter latericius]|uniref:PorT family protein n=1 Tax=Rufibacter latericius TaxID=2487040 RepID=A0A3M9MU03_9BACT|nr:outer membrane beta-barrel protein [Rufibacter latericius]RNI28665.1 PorT family protein [Rufibacter latericius]